MFRLSPRAFSHAALLFCAFGLPRLASADPTLVPLAQAAPAVPVTHVVWTSTDGKLSLWNYTDSGSFTQNTYGPYAGWSVKAIADGPDGRQRVLWTNTNGAASIWSLDNTTGQFTQYSFGPYAGWSALDLSVTGAATGSGTLSGPAGGDLLGLYPNPAIAPGVIDHTKLASDPGSLGPVSGGHLTVADATHVGVQGSLTVSGDLGLGSGLIAASNDINIYRNTTVHGTLGTDGNISSNGTDFYLKGRGGGQGNNGGRGLALVDGGPLGGGLVINYMNDFGAVNIASDANVHGNMGIDGGVNLGSGEINSANDINIRRTVTVRGNLGVTSQINCIGDIISSQTVTAKSLQLTGGSDLAEPYTIAAFADTHPLPGMVVAIDPNQTGQMRVCAHAYDTTVGGIISGAGGVNPGITLRQTGTVADGTLPIACTGRVWCWCDADAGGAVSPGDLLTTSDTPGHAMRVSDYGKARGAILGKAMSSLKTGKGLVLVLVTLQ